MKQEQFLSVVSPDEAHRRFREAVSFAPLPPEDCPLDSVLGRVLAENVVAPNDVPSFTRSNFDGFAVRAADTYGATEEHPATNTSTGTITRRRTGMTAALSVVQLRANQRQQNRLYVAAAAATTC